MSKSVYAIFFCCLIAGSADAQVTINEICPANADGIYDPDFYNFSGWVELYNAGDNDLSIGGYYLSDKLDERAKWSIPAGTIVPAKGYLLIWCDGMYVGLHANFSLDSDGEELVLSNSSTDLVDQITFPEQYTNIAYGRLGDGAAAWGYLLSPTPGTSNSKETTTQILDGPVFETAPGPYSGAQEVSLQHSQPEATIRYTTDGSEPTVLSTLYTSSISVSTTSTIKAKAFREGYIPSKTTTGTYFISEHAFTLPVVSISTNTSYLWDDTIGIYTDGTNGIPGNCESKPVNWAQDWDRHATMEYFEADGSRRLEQHVDIRIGGACSRGWPQKSLVIKARDKYGKKTFDGAFFQTKDVDEFGGFMLRNSGNDFNVTLFRDELMQSLTIGQMDIDYMAYQPTIVYLNGEYWGIQNLREKIDADFIESNYGLKKDEIDLLENLDYALEGTPDAYLNYKNTLQLMDRTERETFEFIDANIDVQEYINYLVAEIYYCNTDWPGNNIKFWRPRASGGKFRWILWDTDFGFGLNPDVSYPTHPTLDFATAPDNPEWPNPAWSTLHIRMVLENPQFRSRFIRAMSTALSTTFAPDRVLRAIDEFHDRIKAEIPFHKERWGGDVSDWEYEVQRLRDFAVARNAFMRQHVAAFFGLNESAAAMTITTTPAGAGTFKLNNVTADAPMESSSYFKGVPYRVEPIAAAGYRFKEWTIRKREAAQVPLIDVGDTWKYFDQGTLPDANWAQAGFDDALWAEGPAQLGYGDHDEKTLVDYGPDVNNKYITTYFRKTFVVDDTTHLEAITANLLVDDGAVVYLNGVEIYRNNMPAGAITSTTEATQAFPVENGWLLFTIVKGLLQQGVNVLAVEVHQSSGVSTDISFALSLHTVRIGDETEETTDMAQLYGIAYTDVNLEATFELDDRVVTGVVINEISAKPSTVKDPAGDAEDWIELYNAGTKTVNLAGLFITDNLSQKRKHLLLAGKGDEMRLAPGGYKVLWADEELREGVDHLSFKLSAEGEDVGLYQELDGEIRALDEVTFDEQPGEGSWSRIPNATGPFAFATRQTPREANTLVTGVLEETRFSVYPNPVTSGFQIHSSSPVTRAELMDCYGRTVLNFPEVQSDAWLPVDGIAPGLYLLRIQSGSAWHLLKLVKE